MPNKINLQQVDITRCCHLWLQALPQVGSRWPVQHSGQPNSVC